MIDLDLIKNKILSTDLGVSHQGIQEAIGIIDEISDQLLKCIKLSQDHLISTEQVSMVVTNFLRKLDEALNGEDLEFKFYAATLVMHYNVRNTKAKNILLESIRSGSIDIAATATVILCRQKNNQVKQAVMTRLKDKTLSDKERYFF